MEFLTERLQFLDLTDANETEQNLIERLLFTSKEPLEVPWCTLEIKQPEDDQTDEKWQQIKNGNTERSECLRAADVDHERTVNESKADKNVPRNEYKSRKDNKPCDFTSNHAYQKRSPQPEKVFACPPNSVSHIQMYPMVPSMPGVFVSSVTAGVGVHPPYVQPVPPRYTHNMALPPSQRRPSPKGNYSREASDSERFNAHQRQCVEQKCDYPDPGNVMSPPGVENYGPPSYRTIQPLQPYYYSQGAPPNSIYVQPAVLPVYSSQLFNPYGHSPMVYRQPEASPGDYPNDAERNCGPYPDAGKNRVGYDGGEFTGEKSSEIVCENPDRLERVENPIGGTIEYDSEIAERTSVPLNNDFNEGRQACSNRINPEPFENTFEIEKGPNESEKPSQNRNVESSFPPENNNQVAKSNTQKHEHLCYHTEVVVKLPKKKSTYSSEIHVSSAVKKINVSGGVTFSNGEGVDSRGANVNHSRSNNFNHNSLTENGNDNTNSRDFSDNRGNCAIGNCNTNINNSCCGSNKDDSKISYDEHSFIIKNSNNSNISDDNNNNDDDDGGVKNFTDSCVNRNDKNSNNNSSSHQHHHRHQRNNRNNNNNNNNIDCQNDCNDEECGDVVPMLKTANVIIEISSGRHTVNSSEILPSNGPRESVPKTEEISSNKCPEKPVPAIVGKSWASLFSSSMSDGKSRPLARVSPHVKDDFKQSGDPKADVSSTNEHANFSSAKVSDNKLLEDSDLRQLGEFLCNYSPDHRIISLQPRGLTNRNNWCYVNAILQSLIACPPFYNLLKALPAFPRRKRSSETLIIDNMVDFVNEFGPLPVNARIGKREKSARNKEENCVEIVPGPAFEPSGIYKILDKVRGESSFNIEGRQEDAEEFLSCLLNGLSDEMFELMKVVDAKKSNVPKEDVSNQTNGNAEDEAEWNVIGPRNKSSVTRRAVCGRTPIADIFRGQLRSRVQRAGDQSTDNVQPFFTLQLDIEKAASVKEALELLVGKDQLEGVTCSKTHREVEAWTQTTLEDLPVVLILHLKCFDYKPDGCSKIIKNVDFPIDLKIDGKLMSVNRTKYSSKQKNYKLVAVVYHDGKEASKGHYVTDAYHVGYGCWIRYDDGAVRSVPESYVLKPRAPRMPYLLYYRRGDTVSAIK